MILKIVSVGDPVLRKQARPLKSDEIRSSQIQDLIAYMRDTMHDAPGVGLAAPQIGQLLQLAVIEDKSDYHKNLSQSDLKDRDRKPVPFHVIINPQIELLTPSNIAFHEGCLSLPGFMAVVPRASRIRVICLDEHGQSRTIEATGWYARILQHEIDHLNGRVYIDRMQSETFSTLDNYQKNLKK
ncbi:peptide deformylase [Alloacidobacterium dinghuense]|uniref:Peptide deformylase n=1 Tax=Alloacidobacterium dinghuense TaxID=2763107 RepID=A0A7G8BC35_9BACT|nr:peptide deformylase [Alloacidobacterium dinghuense]QNI30105.1 peptide deformylase [Alloacidobacterium dinghuense]